MRSPRTSLVLVVALALLSSCATPKDLFMHRMYRETYSIQADELARLQFYISTEVLAKRIDAGGGNRAEDLVLVPRETGGVVVDSGPDWLRVSFEEGGRGVYFLSDPQAIPDSSYWLATERPGQPDLIMVKDSDPKVIFVEGQEFRVEYGSNARLLVNSKDLEKLIATRRHATGREPKR